MLIVPRYFHQALPDSLQETDKARPLSDYFEKKVVVILGSPGIGKSTEFSQAGKQEPGAIHSTVSRFLADPLEIYKGKTIYLDALDEYRAESHKGSSIIDAIRGRLISLGLPKVRLSCRSQEWHQGSDVNALADIADPEPVFILRMLPLSADDIAAIAAAELGDVAQFLEGAARHRLEEPLGNPETLMLYLSVFQSSGGWPRSRAELMSDSSKLLIGEQNDIHERAHGATVSDTRLMHAAEDVAAVITLGDKDGVALGRTSASDRYIPLQELPNIDLDAALICVRRRLFSSETPEQVHPLHKTMGDYLAAKSLCRRIQNKSLPLSRAISVLTGTDGAPVSHLRDVFAWLVAMLPEYSDRLLASDPFGTLIYGDVEQWSIPTRRIALNVLSHYAATKDPWFSSEAWHVPSLGGLVHEDLLEDFRHILKHELNMHVTGVVLDALQFGPPLTEIAGDLMEFIRDTSRPELRYVKKAALRAFLHISPDITRELRPLLEDIQSGTVSDENHGMRTLLLTRLYPTDLAPDEVVHYFDDTNAVGRGTMSNFVRIDLISITPDDLLPDLAAAVAANPDAVKKLDPYNRREMNGALIRKLLEVHGQSAMPKEIYGWLGIFLDRHHTPHLNQEDTEAIRAYFTANANIYEHLFQYWLEQEEIDTVPEYFVHHIDFRNRTLMHSIPSSFTEVLLDWAANESDTAKAEFLFELASKMIMGGPNCGEQIGLNELFKFVEAQPKFAASLEKIRITPILDFRMEQALRRRRHLELAEKSRIENVGKLEPHIAELKSGSDLQRLTFGAGHWLRLALNSPNSDEPIERIRLLTNSQLADAMVDGFRSALVMPTPNAPTEIVRSKSKGKRSFDCLPTLAGAEILHSEQPEQFVGLPAKNLKAVLAYRKVYYVRGNSDEWEKALAANRPEAFGEVLAEIWRAELSLKGTQYLTDSHVGGPEDPVTAIVLLEMQKLLAEIQDLAPRILLDLLTTICQHGNMVELKPILQLALSKDHIQGTNLTIWLTIGALLASNDYEDRFQRKLRSRPQDISVVQRLLAAGCGNSPDREATVEQLQMSISTLGRYFNNVDYFGDDNSGEGSEDRDAAQNIRGMIDKLAGVPTVGAAAAFVSLISEPSLHEWHNHLRHRQAEQARNLRDAQFTLPTAKSICDLLAGGGPANIADLQAIVVNTLDEIAAEIQGDNTNLWRSFWILSGRGKLDKPKIENDSRDVLLREMRTYLNSKFITVEPEAAAADEKRVDMRLTHATTGTMPVEIKRDDNAEIWTAMQDQLLERYANDPATSGYGIYLVLWHGDKGNGCYPPPKALGILKPKSALELQDALDQTKPSQHFVVRVIDVSKPHG